MGFTPPMARTEFMGYIASMARKFVLDFIILLARTLHLVYICKVARFAWVGYTSSLARTLLLGYIHDVARISLLGYMDYMAHPLPPLRFSIRFPRCPAYRQREQYHERREDSEQRRAHHSTHTCSLALRTNSPPMMANMIAHRMSMYRSSIFQSSLPGISFILSSRSLPGAAGLSACF